MDRQAAALRSLAPLFRYPDCGTLAYVRSVIRAQVACEGGGHAARELELLEREVRELSDDALEELYARCFDINPAVSLDVGFHLFGLAYKRGEFLVKLGDAHRRLGTEVGTELADHLPLLLELGAAMEPAERAEFIASCVAPAVRKMGEAAKLAGAQGLLRTVTSLDEWLRNNFGCDEITPPPPDDGYDELEEPKTQMMF